LGLAALLLGGLSGQVQAQATAGTRVAVVNVGLVFTKYEKAIFYKSELENTLKPFKTKGEDIVEKMKPYAKALQEKKVTEPKLKEQYEQYLLQQKRTLEDLEAEAKKLVSKKQEDQIITLYKEVIGTIQKYAQDNGYHLVLGYGQQIDGDPFSFAN